MNTTVARGLMLLDRFADGTQSYRIACDCGSADCDVTAWIETQNEADLKLITVTFYADMNLRRERFWQRVGLAWQILRHGSYRQEHELILNHEASQNLIKVLQHSVRPPKSKSRASAW